MASPALDDSFLPAGHHVHDNTNTLNQRQWTRRSAKSFELPQHRVLTRGGLCFFLSPVEIDRLIGLCYPSQIMNTHATKCVHLCTVPYVSVPFTSCQFQSLSAQLCSVSCVNLPLAGSNFSVFVPNQKPFWTSIDTPLVWSRAILTITLANLDRFLQFLPHCMECSHGIAMRILSVRPSVCLSVCLSVCQTRA